MAKNKAKSIHEVMGEVFGEESTYRPAVPTDFGSGRQGWSVSLFGLRKTFLGTLKLIPRPDGEYSVSIELGVQVRDALAEAGVTVHKRARPTRKALSVPRILRLVK